MPRHPLTPEERTAFIAAASAFLAAKEQIEFAAHEAASVALRQSHAAKGQAVVDVMLAHRQRTGAIPQISFRGYLFILVLDKNNPGQLLVMPESYFVDVQEESAPTLQVGVARAKGDPELTDQELADFCSAATAWIGVQEQLELVAEVGSIPDAMRAAHYEKSKAVLRPLISCWQRTNALPTLSYRGHLFHASVAIDGTVDLVTFREEKVRRIE